ncbi:MAG TPA: hypothetical protein VE467_04545 [Chryseolinea sp.]|nr:hypothetical protein [Chryseolinea sp.]
MKKLLLIILFVGGLSVQAHERELFTIDAKPISSQAIPSDLMKSIKQDFPGNEVVEYYLLTADKVNPEWAVVMEDNLKPTISFEFEVSSLKLE